MPRPQTRQSSLCIHTQPSHTQKHSSSTPNPQKQKYSHSNFLFAHTRVISTLFALPTTFGPDFSPQYFQLFRYTKASLHPQTKIGQPGAKTLSVLVDMGVCLVASLAAGPAARQSQRLRGLLRPGPVSGPLLHRPPALLCCSSCPKLPAFCLVQVANG